MMRSNDVAARKCAKCHRVFSKVEHLRRHHRSHTGERPFKCKACGRTYARSDVLNRHIRNHHLAPPQDGDSAVVPKSRPAMDELLEEIRPPLDADYSEEADTGSGNLPSDRPSSSPRNTPPGCATPQDIVIQDSLNDNWNERHIDDDILGLQPPCTEGLPEFLGDIRTAGVTDDQRRPQLAPIPSPRRDFFPFDPHMDPSLGIAQPPITRDTFDTIPPGMDFGSVLWDDLLLTPPASGYRGLHHHQKDNISNEQFEQVRRLWPTRRRRVTPSPSPMCWDDILLHPEDNIFSSTELKSMARLEPLPATGSPWGLTEACRHRLAESITTYAPHSQNQTIDLDRDGPWDGEPPPTDILDLCLDLYFSQFHVHLPFVHPGTFKACDTPSILLFPMCLVGMMILNRSAARKLIAKYLPGAIHHCRSELTSQNLRYCAGPELLTVLGSACLLLFVAASTAEIAFEDKRQSLYEEAISVAKDRGLFGSRGYSHSIIQAVGDDAIMWKAWARIQSAQRLTACLILADVYSAHMLNLAPILSPENIQMPLTCCDALFTVYSSQKWKELAAIEDPWRQPPSVVLDIQNLPSGLTGLGLQTALTLIWLRILTPRRKVQGHAAHVLEPWTPNGTLSCENTEDSNAPSVGSCLASAFDVYAWEFKRGNANLLILWHYLCLRLTSDIAVIEDAAGRNGPEAAKAALERLRPWAKSPSARRACLHAAQMFMVINNHRRSDGLMLHSEMALFNAALVMGFYFFTAPNFKSSDGACYDVFEEVDWTHIGTLGLESQSLDGGVSSPVSAAAAFIQNGGPVCFHGAEYCSPYGAARRSFMNVASQLEEVGKWNVQEYCDVLHVISDTLLKPDGQDIAL